MVKPLEDVVDVLRGNAAAVVGYLDLEHGGGAGPGNTDMATSRRVVQGILHQISQSLAGPLWIAEQPFFRLSLYLNGLTLLICPGLQIPDGAVNQLGDKDIPALKDNAAAVQPGDLQHGLDQLLHALEGRPHLAGKLPYRVRVLRLTLQDLLVHHQGRQRRLQLVGDIRDGELEELLVFMLRLVFGLEHRRKLLDFGEQLEQIPLLVLRQMAGKVSIHVLADNPRCLLVQAAAAVQEEQGPAQQQSNRHKENAYRGPAGCRSPVQDQDAGGKQKHT